MINYNDLTRLLIKISGAVIIIFVLISIPGYVAFYFSLRLEDDSFWLFFIYSIIPVIIPIGGGLLMLYFPGMIANKLINGSQSEVIAEHDIEPIQSIAFGVLGLYLLFRVISDLTYNFSYLYLNQKAYGLSNISDIDTYARIIATAFELLFALYLLFGAKGLSKMINKFRDRVNRE